MQWCSARLPISTWLVLRDSTTLTGAIVLQPDSFSTCYPQTYLVFLIGSMIGFTSSRHPNDKWLKTATSLQSQKSEYPFCISASSQKTNWSSLSTLYHRKDIAKINLLFQIRSSRNVYLNQLRSPPIVNRFQVPFSDQRSCPRLTLTIFLSTCWCPEPINSNKFEINQKVNR